MKDILNQLIEHKTLSQQQAKEVLKNLATFPKKIKRKDMEKMLNLNLKDL